MKVPKYVKNTIVQISVLASKQIRLNKKLTEQLEKMGVNMDCEAFEDAFSYVEGDRSPETFIKYLEGLPK